MNIFGRPIKIISEIDACNAPSVEELKAMISGEIPMIEPRFQISLGTASGRLSRKHFPYVVACSPLPSIEGKQTGWRRFVPIPYNHGGHSEQ